jgi:hypothetical protein
MMLIVLAAILGGAAGFSIFVPYGILVACGSAPLAGSLAASLAAAVLYARRVLQDGEPGSVSEGNLTALHALASHAGKVESAT